MTTWRDPAPPRRPKIHWDEVAVFVLFVLIVWLFFNGGQF